MNFKLLFLLPLIGMSLKGYSQQPVISLTGGLNFGKWKLDEKSNFNHSRVGILLGVAVELEVQEALSLQSGLQYTMFGTHFKYNNDESIYKTNYLLMPLLGKYKFENGISIHAGPEIGFLMSAKSVLDGDHYDFQDDMKPFDVFFALGAEYALKSGLSFGFRIHHGLTNVENGADTAIHNRGFSLMASYPLSELLP
jgi:hypothetical protein